VNGEVAELVALVAYGNRFLSTGGEPPELFPEHTTFRWVESVGFGEHEGGGTAGWYAELRDRGVERLSLHLPAVDPKLTAFAGAARGIAVEEPGGRDAWQGSWKVKDLDAPDRRIWTVRYERFRLGAAVPPAPALEEAAAALAAALAATRDLAAHEPMLEHFASVLEGALALLAALEPQIPYHDDLVPEGWDRGACRLLAAATSAWVFGGMGSWNDIGFDEPAKQDEYRRVSGDLYTALTNAASSAANVPV
jgi:hypothetical protein